MYESIVRFGGWLSDAKLKLCLERDVSKNELRDSDSPKSMWLTPVNRSLLTFKAYVNGELGSYFTTYRFIDDLAQQKNVRSADLARKSYHLVLAIFLLLFSPNIDINTPIIKVNFEQIYALQEILLVIVSVCYMNVNGAILDFYVVDRCLGIIFNSFNMYSGQFFYMHKSSGGIGQDATQLKFFGPESGKAHKGVAFLGLVVWGGVVLLIWVVPLLVISHFAFGALVDVNRFSATWWMNLIACLLAYGSVALTVVSVFVPVPFKSGILLEGMLADKSIDLEAAKRAVPPEGPTD